MVDPQDEHRTKKRKIATSRRKALAKLGLAVGAVYMAPTLVRLDRSAMAKVFPTPCPPPHAPGHGAPWCR